jgi:hypothetical protein
MVALWALSFSAPAFARQEPPPSLFDAAPTQEPGTVAPSDGGRSITLLALSLVAMAGAGVLAAMALRGPARAIFAAEGEAVPSRRQRRVSAARAASAEASAAARLGMPVIPAEAPEAAAEKPCWQPRVRAPAPLPAFGPGAGPAPPPPPPPAPPQRLSR